MTKKGDFETSPMECNVIVAPQYKPYKFLFMLNGAMGI